LRPSRACDRRCGRGVGVEVPLGTLRSAYLARVAADPFDGDARQYVFDIGAGVASTLVGGLLAAAAAGSRERARRVGVAPSLPAAQRPA